LGGVDGVAAHAAATSLESARAAVDAASLVFTHSVVDASAAGFLRVTSMVSPADWQKFLDARKWSVSDVRKEGYEKLFQSLLMDEMEHVERNFSLLKKGERLRQLCRPEAEWRIAFKYDEQEFARIDGLRHDIVHGTILGSPIASIDDDLRFLENIGWYFFSIVGRRYRLEFSPMK
jgi:hypothetical protein